MVTQKLGLVGLGYDMCHLHDGVVPQPINKTRQVLLVNITTVKQALMAWLQIAVDVLVGSDFVGFGRDEVWLERLCVVGTCDFSTKQLK